MLRPATLTASLLAALALAAPAAAEEGLTLNGATLPCSTSDGVRFCGGTGTTVPTFDGVPIDINVAYPVAAADRPMPLIMMFHGWGGSEVGLSGMKRFLDRGYAVFSMSDRGWGSSCGGQLSKTGACAEGYNRLLDTRYEVRDAQLFAGLLVDAGLVDPDRIGAIGGSYGGGMSMALAALRDRVAVGEDPATAELKLEPWRSPKGTPLKLAAATPDIPWTDLAYSLVPNGRMLDYVADAPYAIDPANPTPGVMKASFVTGLLALGLIGSNYALPGTDPDADLVGWYTAILAGEPYGASPVVLDALEELTKHHSSYGIDDSVAPAPLLISNGFTDDLFPADEALRFYNRTRANHPKAPMALVFMDHGHQRGQNKPEDIAYLRARQDEWLDHYVRDGGRGRPPAEGVVVRTQACGKPSESFAADSWRELSPGEVRLTETEHQRTLSIPNSALAPLTDLLFDDLALPVPPDLLKGLQYDPILGTVLAQGACSAPQEIPGVEDLVTDLPGATYELEVTGDGFVMAGSPTIVAELASPGPESQLALRLIDVDPEGGQTLVTRGLYRADSTVLPTRQVFQLHPNAYRFEPGHRVRLEVLPMDMPYGRLSNTQLPVTIAELELRVPTHDSPDGGQVRPPAPKIVPAGYTLAPGYASPGAPAGSGTGGRGR